MRNWIVMELILKVHVKVNVLKIFEFEQTNVQNKNNFAKLKLGFLLILLIVDCTNIKMIKIN
jgi:hypothetical protein